MSDKSYKVFSMATMVVLAILAVVFGCLWYKSMQSQKTPNQNPIAQNTNTQKFKKDYPSGADNNRFVYKTADEIIKQLESGTGLIYFGFPDCPWCQKYVEYLDQVARAEGLKEISYYNIKQARADNTAQYQKIVALLKNHGLNTDKSGNPRIFVPEVVAVKNGKVIGRDNTSSSNSTAKDGTPNEWWTEEQIKTLKNKLKTIIRSVVDCDTTCNV